MRSRTPPAAAGAEAVAAHALSQPGDSLDETVQHRSALLTASVCPGTVTRAGPLPSRAGELCAMRHRLLVEGVHGGLVTHGATGRAISSLPGPPRPSTGRCSMPKYL